MDFASFGVRIVVEGERFDQMDHAIIYICDICAMALFRGVKFGGGPLSSRARYVKPASNKRVGVASFQTSIPV